MGVKDKLEEAKSIVSEMDEIVSVCMNYNGDHDMWGVMFDDFFKLLNSFPFDIETYDFDETYKDDILSRYNQVKSFMRGFGND